MEIKTFKFEVSNWSSAPIGEDKDKSEYRRFQDRLWTPSGIDAEIGSFIQDKKIISIDVTPITVQNHNNARGNLVLMQYTVLYEEEKPHV